MAGRRTEQAMEPLKDYLASLPPGSVADTGRLEPLLAECWNEFRGCNESGMHPGKLRSRMEKVTWNPPRLTFVIERHGATVGGSTRAEVQQWEVDLQAQTVNCETIGRRQLVAMEPRLNVRPLAEEVARLILAGDRQDSRVTWRPDGRLRVNIGRILPEGSAVRETLAGRRRRFRAALDEMLTEAGWHTLGSNVYAPS